MQKLYEESLKYLEGYARALTESDGKCRNSDFTMTQTNTHLDEGPEYMCIMDRRDMKLLVKHIYMILYNPNEVNYRKIHQIDSKLIQNDPKLTQSDLNELFYSNFS